MRLSVAIAAVCLSIVTLSAADEVKAAIRKTTEIPAQGLGPALQALAKSHGFQIVYVANEVKSIRSQGAIGELTSEEALVQLLSGTGLTFRAFGDNAVGIVPVTAEAGPSVEFQRTQRNLTPDASVARDVATHADVWSAFRIAQAETATYQDVGHQHPSSSKLELEEVVVTGTHIRGATNTASPVLVYDRKDIDLSGVSSVQEFVQRLPQNFGGGASEDTMVAVSGGDTSNYINGTAINLRGLGAGSTLVLVNGRRIAPANLDGNFVDISSIPLNAIERVEMVTDGASAIYGADAVGGAVNFILRDEFAGPETRIRYGAVTQGDSDELQIGQTLGANWDRGSMLLSYEYLNRGELKAKDRQRASLATDDFTLLPRQERHSAFLTASHHMDGGVKLFADGLAARREAPFSSAIESGPSRFDQQYDAEVTSYSATLGARVDRVQGFGFELSSTYAASASDVDGVDLLANGAWNLRQRVDADILSIDAKADGKLWQTSAGPVLFAIGGQYRSESYERENLLNATLDYRGDRDVLAGFLEVRLPLLGPAKTRPEVSRLELILADRYEEYSDFGTTNNPKVGLVWWPLPGMKLRGSYGTSFKAPILSNLNPAFSAVRALAVFDPLAGANRTVLFLGGGNPDLAPEEADTWSIGADIEPEWLPAFHASVTYYEIDFDDRIVNPAASIGVSQALVNEHILGPQIVERNPSLSELQALAAHPLFRSLGGVNPLASVAILDYRMQNLSVDHTRGIDVSLAYKAQTARGSWQIGVDSTYILDFDRQFSLTAPVVELLNTPYNPVDLRARAQAVWQRDGATLGMYVNYTDSYKDSRVGVARSRTSVASWLTADLTLTYDFSATQGPLSATSLAIGALNVTDEDPPFVANAFYGVDYDGANANALGRFVFVQMSKRW